MLRMLERSLMPRMRKQWVVGVPVKGMMFIRDTLGETVFGSRARSSMLLEHRIEVIVAVGAGELMWLSFSTPSCPAGRCESLETLLHALRNDC